MDQPVNDREQLRAGTILVISWAKLIPKGETWPIAGRDFAAAARQLAPANGFAGLFWVTENVAGLVAPDYDLILSKMQTATLIAYESPEFRRFRVNVTSPYAINHLSRRVDATAIELREAAELAILHWKIANEAGELNLAGVQVQQG